MAIIILDKEERFSHSHNDNNMTSCISGLVEVCYRDVTRVIGAGQSISIPEGVEHTLRNVGKQQAYIGCYHSPRPGD